MPAALGIVGEGIVSRTRNFMTTASALFGRQTLLIALPLHLVFKLVRIGVCAKTSTPVTVSGVGGADLAYHLSGRLVNSLKS